MNAPEKLSVSIIAGRGRTAGTFPAFGSAQLSAQAAGAFTRVAYSAATWSPIRWRRSSWQGCAIDWDATIAYRRTLWGLGLGVAEAMDTAQRGMGLDWTTSRDLIRRSIAASRDVKGRCRAAPAPTNWPPRPPPAWTT